MGKYKQILAKLEAFIRKYYIKQSIQGILVFLTLGLLFWIAITSFEFVLWLDNSWRLTLFIIFVAVELYLAFRFVFLPLSYLIRLRQGLNNRDASKIIGQHFPNVDDKLLNFLDLVESNQESELLLASIEQRTQALGPVPFTAAINIRDSFKYATYLILPILVLVLFWVSGNISSFFDSHQRMVHYDMAYERPAPFSFMLLNENLQVLENQPLEIRAEVIGEFVPEDVSIVIDGTQLLMQYENGYFSYTIEPPVKEGVFYFSANGWNSKTYIFGSLVVPKMLDFEMVFEYPGYLRRPTASTSGTGNATVPEGTQVSWKIQGKDMDEVLFKSEDSVQMLHRDENNFSVSKRFFTDLSYQITTSNSFISDYEKFDYEIEVIKDNYPTITVEQFLDSLTPNESYYTGQVADDYGLRQVRLVYYPIEERDEEKYLILNKPNGNVDQFYYTFPSGLTIEEGKIYELYFEVKDNDGLRGGKTVKSQVFRNTILTYKELKNKELKEQNALLGIMENEVERYKEREKELSKIQEEQIERSNLSFDDKGRIKQFLEKQQEQERLMERFTKELKNNIDKQDEENRLSELLKERLERQELEAKKNEKLLQELNELADRIEKEELQKRLEELAKKQSTSTRNLEQILELTKRYYVSEKTAQLARELEELSKNQEELSKQNNENSLEEQLDLNKDFDKVAEELEELRKDNQDLKKPFSIDASKKDEENVKRDQQEATEELSKQQNSENENNSSQNGASKKQKSAADKMKEMSEKMQQSAMGGGGASITEDAEMLRQILDNLITFSFNQEDLLDRVERTDFELDNFSSLVREQNELKNMFEHVDDSLFALSLRRAELSEFVNEQITEVYYNIDKSLESIAENQIYRGASYQQYVMNATNSLADFLANVLDNMQQSLQSGQGQGQGSDFQLPDIIKGQQGIQEKMEGSGEQGQQKGQQNGRNIEEQREGEGKKNGEGEGQNGKRNGDQMQPNSNGTKDGNGQGGLEEELGLEEVYKIYKEQQRIRNELEKQLNDFINKSDRDLARKLLQQMENFENDLLQNGITERTRNKVNTIQHQLLKLENAALKQGKKNERESQSNKKEYTNPILTKPEYLKNRKNNIEILNRQALPLRQNFEKKVRVYFNND